MHGMTRDYVYLDASTARTLSWLCPSGSLEIVTRSTIRSLSLLTSMYGTSSEVSAPATSLMTVLLPGYWRILFRQGSHTHEYIRTQCLVFSSCRLDRLSQPFSSRQYRPSGAQSNSSKQTQRYKTISSTPRPTSPLQRHPTGTQVQLRHSLRIIPQVYPGRTSALTYVIPTIFHTCHFDPVSRFTTA